MAIGNERTKEGITAPRHFPLQQKLMLPGMFRLFDKFQFEISQPCVTNGSYYQVESHFTRKLLHLYWSEYKLVLDIAFNLGFLLLLFYHEAVSQRKSLN